ncbi:MAG TPA: YceI family protein [Propionibacteriaceae bacterium]|nr:YceI family protein [Propionibacteriaceae bacterium]
MHASITHTTRAPTPAVGHYRIDPVRTSVRFSTRHLFGLGAVTGTVKLREADFSITEHLSATVHAVLDAASFDTGNPRRDGDVRSARYLDVTAYPDITFSSEQVRLQEGKWAAVGTVTAHGVAAPVDLTLDELRRDDEELILRASAKIDRYAHQVTAGKGLAARWLTVEVTAIARRDSIDA